MLRHPALLGALLLGAVFYAAAQPAPRAQAVCSEADSIARDLAEISGMKLRRPVPCDFITKEKVNDFIQERLKEAAKPEEIRAEEMVLKHFGLVPPDFDLAKTTVELLTEQAAAFYDYDRKKLFITDSTPSPMQSLVLAHELAHAVADQSFDLGKFIRKGRETDDGSAARMAVMEGQATWLMSEMMARKMGGSLRSSPDLAAAMSGMSEAGGGQYPVFDTAPLYFRLSLVFPYTKGMLFQDSVLRRYGDGGFAEPFRRAPISTQQILHPEKYFASVEPTRPPLPNVKLPRGYKGVVGGVLGEFDHAVLIEQFADKQTAQELAPHWRGCSFEIREDRKLGRSVLLYAAEWDNAEAARRYFEFYKKALGGKWKKLGVRTETPTLYSGTGDGFGFELRLSGALVTSVEGLSSEIN